MTKDMKKIGLLFNTQKPEAIEKGVAALALGEGRGDQLPLPAARGLPPSPSPASTTRPWRKEAAFAVILGGDGTFLRAARYTFGNAIPLYGINLGRLGFLAIGRPGVRRRRYKIDNRGPYTLQRRHLLKGQVWRSGRLVHELHALNDFVISKGQHRARH